MLDKDIRETREAVAMLYIADTLPPDITTRRKVVISRDMNSNDEPTSLFVDTLSTAIVHAERFNDAILLDMLRDKWGNEVDKQYDLAKQHTEEINARRP